MQIQWKPLPSTLVFVVSGQDTSGHQWSQTVSVSTTTPARQTTSAAR
jgi:hypothetical protein